MHIVVIVAGLYFGPLDASVVAAIFALSSMWKATFTSTEIGDIIFSPVLSGNPLGSILMSFVSRIIFAVITGYAFRIISKRKVRHLDLVIVFISVIATLVHTVLVYIPMDIFFDTTSVQTSDSFAGQLLVNNLVLFLVTIAVVLFFHKLAESKTIKDMFSTISVAPTSQGKKWSRQIFLFLLLIPCIFICMHLVSRVNWYLASVGSAVDDEYGAWINALIIQLMVGIAGVVGVLYFISEWAREYSAALLLEATEKAKSAAEQANAAKTAFLFSMSHDIRTPMNAITGYAAMAKKHSGEKNTVDDYLTKIEIAGNQLLSLINQVLEMSRIESGKITFSEKPVNLTELVRTIVLVAGADCTGKDIALESDIEGIKDIYVLTDSDRVSQILVNILGNAVKYTMENGSINISLKEKESKKEGFSDYVFTIADTGIGMSREFVDKIFDEFARESTSTVSGIQGTGLGMPIVKKLTDLMDGTIDIQSEQGKGTTVTVTLPMKPCREIPETPKTNEATSEIKLDGMRVLLVEDNEMNREIASEILKEHGIVVREAIDGDIAVEMVKNSGTDPYDLVLMDIQMPKMDGYEATRQIRNLEDKSLAVVPIIAMTANAFEEDRENALEAGMDGHLAKPISIPKLIEMLAHFR